MNSKRLIIFKTDSTELVLPITPQEYEIAQETAYNKVNICSVGDVFVGGLEAVQTIKLMSFFPANSYSFSNTKDTDPQKYINAIEALRKNKTVFRLIISNTDINLPVRVQSFLYGEQDGSNDVEYQLILGVHRELETVEVAGWTLPKRKYDPPKSKKKGTGSSGKQGTRTSTPAHEKPKTCHGYITTNSGRFNNQNVDEVM